MDIVQHLSTSGGAIRCIDMHTTGEPTRIVLNGYPTFPGTLLEQRTEAKRSHDHIRRKLLLEPRGHSDMYGAILRPDTELTTSGEAHMGVLFMTNDGYSTMCGHATIALGRFLLDTHDKTIFPRRGEVRFDPMTRTASLGLHCPCGLVKVTVPTNEDGTRSDPSRPVSHISVPSFVTGIDIQIDLPSDHQWPELADRQSVTADFSYGGAFYCLISAKELGFPLGLKGKVDIAAMDTATRRLKAAVNSSSKLRKLFSHPDHDDLGFLYSIIVVDKDVGQPNSQSTEAETGLCFFSDQQIDRSPTGSGVAARVALGHAKGSLSAREKVTYHSLVSSSLEGCGGFIGSLHGEGGITKDGFPIVRVLVEGYASYTGTSSFVVEDSDAFGDDGFLFKAL